MAAEGNIPHPIESVSQGLDLTELSPKSQELLAHAKGILVESHPISRSFHVMLISLEIV